MSHPIEIADIDHIVLRVSDLDRMLDFYTTVLGCTVVRRNDELGLVHLSAGTSLIDMVTVDGRLGQVGGVAPGNSGRNLDHFCLRVRNYQPRAICSFLRDHGLEVEEPAQRFGADGHGLSIYLQDPENNTVELRGDARGS